MKEFVGHCPLLASLVLLQLLCAGSGAGTGKLRTPCQFINIRGNVGTGMSEKLPVALTRSWSCWTFEDSVRLEKVEDASDNEGSDEDGSIDDTIGWVNPMSYDDLFLPADLPLPKVDPAIGVLYINGSPRYAMPSLICTLETPAKRWRNRGVSSVPRANGWVDLFGEYTRLSNLKFYCFGQFANDVRFLEDQDGSASWENLSIDKVGGGLLRPNLENVGMEVGEVVEEFQAFLSNEINKYAEVDQLHPLVNGYHFVDIPLKNSRSIRLRGNAAEGVRRIKAYLTDLSYPTDLLGTENDDMDYLDTEPIGCLDITLAKVSPGGESDFLPDVYVDLYEPGNIIER